MKLPWSDPGLRELLALAALAAFGCGLALWRPCVPWAGARGFRGLKENAGPFRTTRRDRR
jgi:hypothetical protein